jgi:hypothetical protein
MCGVKCEGLKRIPSHRIRRIKTWKLVISLSTSVGGKGRWKSMGMEFTSAMKQPSYDDGTVYTYLHLVSI